MELERSIGLGGARRNFSICSSLSIEIGALRFDFFFPLSKNWEYFKMVTEIKVNQWFYIEPSLYTKYCTCIWNMNKTLVNYWEKSYLVYNYDDSAWYFIRFDQYVQFFQEKLQTIVMSLSLQLHQTFKQLKHKEIIKIHVKCKTRKELWSRQREN